MERIRTMFPPLARLSPARLHLLLDVTALIGVIVAAIPILVEFQPYYVPLIMVGSGVAVVAAAIFLYFSAATG